jgi:hypothetical protein
MQLEIAIPEKFHVEYLYSNLCDKQGAMTVSIQWLD